MMTLQWEWYRNLKNKQRRWDGGPCLKKHLGTQSSLVLSLIWNTGLEIISRLTPVKLFSELCFCSDKTQFCPDKYALNHNS